MTLYTLRHSAVAHLLEMGVDPRTIQQILGHGRLSSTLRYTLVTYDQRQITVGSLADGAQVEVLDEFIVPIEITQGESGTAPVTWRLEYTDTLGARHTVDVVGNDVP